MHTFKYLNIAETLAEKKDDKLIFFGHKNIKQTEKFIKNPANY